MDWLSSIVKDAKDQIGDIINTIADEEFLLGAPEQRGAESTDMTISKTKNKPPNECQTSTEESDDEQVEFARSPVVCKYEKKELQHCRSAADTKEPLKRETLIVPCDETLPSDNRKESETMASSRRRNSNDELDSSVPHDSFNFISGLLQEPESAKKLFISYYNINRAELELFEITTPQIAHAKSIIQALPAFDRLRFELCPSILPDKLFWAIYFSIIRDKMTRGAPKDILQRSGMTKDKCTGSSRKGTESASLSEEVAFVTELLFSGAKQTLRLAESFIETVDQTIANSVAAHENSSTSNDSKASFDARGLESPITAEQDKKRARVVPSRVKEMSSSSQRLVVDEERNEAMVASKPKDSENESQLKTENSKWRVTRGKQLNWSYVHKSLSSGSLASADDVYSGKSSCNGSVCDDNLVLIDQKEASMADLEYLPSDEEEYEFI